MKFISLDKFMNFNRIKSLTDKVDDLKSALSNSQILELNEDKSCVRRKSRVNREKDVDACTIYIEKYQKDEVDHDWLNTLFSNFGDISHISLPRFKETNQLMGFAFIEFEDEKAVFKACNFFIYLALNRKPKKQDVRPTLIDELLDTLTVNEAKSANKKSNKAKLNDNKNDLVKKRSSDECDNEDESAKRIKNGTSDHEEDTDERMETTSHHDLKNGISDLDQENEFKQLIKQLEEKYPNKIDQMANYRVISKAKWLTYKKEYFDLKKQFKYQLRKFQPATSIQPRGFQGAKEEFKFDNSLIIRLDYVKSTKTEEESVFKKALRDLDESKSIAYIDFKSSSNQCFIRFKDKESASNYFKNDALSEFGTAVILEGKEEEDYWNEIKKSLQEKKGKKKEKSRLEFLKKKEAKAQSSNDKKNDDEKMEDDNAERAETPITFDKGLIVKLAYDVNVNDELTANQLKQKLKSFNGGKNIVYIDLDTSVHNIFLTADLIRKVCFMRFNKSESAIEYTGNDTLKEFAKEISILDGSEEEEYWKYIKECSKKKHPKKVSKKRNQRYDLIFIGKCTVKYSYKDI